MTLCSIKNDVAYWEKDEFKPIVDNSLLLWMTSDNTIGNTWKDRTGNSFPILNGGYIRTQIDNRGLFGYGIELDGVTGYISISNNTLFNKIKNGLTVSVWVKQLQWNNINYTNIINRRTGTSSGDLFGILGNYQYTNHYCFNLKTVSPSYTCTISTSPTTQLNKWFNITITYDGAFCKIYINNILINSKPATGTIIDEITPVILGAAECGNVLCEFSKCVLGGALIYSRALTDTERTHNYTHSPLYYIEKSIL